MRKRLVAGMLAGLAVATAMQAQSVPAYDAVSIKPNKGDGVMMRVMINQGQDRYAGTNVTLKMLLQYAYGLKTEDQVQGLTGAPDSSRFDVEAKMDAETVETLKKLSKDDALVQQRVMMQAMLADRFKLKVHHETKELGMYDLVIAKGGFKLKDADPNDSYANGMKAPDGTSHPGMMRMGMGELTGQGIGMAGVANFLAQRLHKQVMDKTGLTGKYDIQLKWTPDDMPTESHEATGADSAPSIFTALQEQLGLRLEPVKGPVDTIVVDHVEMPTEN